MEQYAYIRVSTKEQKVDRQLAALAASAAKTIASNLVEIAKLMKSVLGWGMILIGIMSACAFGNSFMKINECVTGREAENLTDRSVVDQAD